MNYFVVGPEPEKEDGQRLQVVPITHNTFGLNFSFLNDFVFCIHAFGVGFANRQFSAAYQIRFQCEIKL